MKSSSPSMPAKCGKGSVGEGESGKKDKARGTTGYGETDDLSSDDDKVPCNTKCQSYFTKFIFYENSNVKLVFVPRSCHKLSHGTKSRCHKKEPFVTSEIVFGIVTKKACLFEVKNLDHKHAFLKNKLAFVFYNSLESCCFQLAFKGQLDFVSKDTGQGRAGGFFHWQVSSRRAAHRRGLQAEVGGGFQEHRVR
jgi:hypothetical protein